MGSFQRKSQSGLFDEGEGENEHWWEMRGKPFIWNVGGEIMQEEIGKADIHDVVAILISTQSSYPAFDHLAS